MIEYKNGIFRLHGQGFSCLLPQFRGTGYDENQRTLTDFGSELFIIEEDETLEQT